MYLGHVFFFFLIEGQLFGECTLLKGGVFGVKNLSNLKFILVGTTSEVC